MSLSLEVKKFVNSESMGEFVTVMLQGKASAANEQIRAMNRERAESNKAAKAALAYEEAERYALGKADKAAAALEEAKAEFAERDMAFEQQKEDHSKLKSEQDKKKAALDRAKQAIDRIEERKLELAKALTDANDAFSAAEKAKKGSDERLAALVAKAKQESEKKAALAEAPDADSGEKHESANSAAKSTESMSDEGTEEKLGANHENMAAEAPETAKAAELTVTEMEKTEDAQVESEQNEKNEAESETTEANRPEERAAEKERSEAAQKADRALEQAETEQKKAHTEFAKARVALEKARKEGASAEETAEKLRKEHDTLEAEFARISSLFASAADELERAKAERSSANACVTALEKEASDANSALLEARRASAAAAKEAERLQAAVRTVKYEQASASMHYLESGKGETLILIHTAGQSLFTFRNVFHKLAMNYHVIAPDLMGHGFSDRPHKFDYSTASHAESIAGLMDALGIERAHLLGFSLGAGYALEAARRYPERIMSVIALSPGGVTGQMPLSIRMMESLVLGGVASRLFSVKTVEKLLDECLFDHTVIGSHEVNEYYKCICDGGSRRAIHLSLSGFGEKRLLASLEEVRTDVLVVSSDMDRWHTTEQGEEYAAALERAEFIVMRNAGHLLHEEKPDRTVELVRSFIPAGYGDYDGREFP